MNFREKSADFVTGLEYQEKERELVKWNLRSIHQIGDSISDPFFASRLTFRHVFSVKCWFLSSATKCEIFACEVTLINPLLG